MIGEISFCDQVGFNIKTDETKRYILERIQAKYGLKIITRHFDKYEDRMLDNLKNRPHMLCVRSNGNPYYLYLTKLNFVNYCIFIDKKIQQGYSYPRMIISHFKFDECLFADTVFDGEMVKTHNGTWSYLINDLVVCKGQHMTDCNIVKRLNVLYETLQRYYTIDAYDICKMLVKKYFKYDEGTKIIDEHIQKVDYSCRGIYIRPLFLKFRDVLINFDDTLVKKVERLKYKHLKTFMLKEDGEKLLDIETASTSSHASNKSSTNSSDQLPPVSLPLPVQPKTQAASAPGDSSSKELLARKTNLPDVYELFDASMTFVGVACLPTLTVSKYMRQCFANKNIVDVVPVRCEFSQRFGKWMPKP